eukprot:Blabericola_migrator_1__10699@NODE_610_length_7290_cov_63_426554_g443_i0_p3_GENE_NODE_610_length_7290_cov_63_426554_g443_i0NODE_610_length_7290_cov_63_426554_g443_i0_p3_ORF_typecomplete_len397_score42_59zfC2H2_8/PF15909_5/0_09zfC2H2_8/PF15909_5/1_1e05zfC2H2_8/PF15909_5/14zfC2H2_8/PF15909_5/0_00016zfC2H2_4/PF13894_6/0_00055zfC2H2_4/PF13894_6/0_0038zfC2H2_4/PF13894_6/1zfC2H2_4/PF13894_6/8_2zfC2H2_4/PF13894_6/0_019zfC2H2_4/PF13894_6/6_8e02zfC2H2_4/PF13894_6/0_073zfC2H2_4/PF13894_6/3_5e03zfC2H2_11/P
MFQCEDCSKTYSRRDHLTRHRRTTHPKGPVVPAAVYTCTHDACAKWFDAKYKLNRHMKKVHTKPYKCRICKMSYSKVNRLRVHLCTSHSDLPHDELRPLFAATLREDGDNELATRLEDAMGAGSPYPVTPSTPGTVSSEPSSMIVDPSGSQYICLFPQCADRKPYNSYQHLKRHWDSHLLTYKCPECSPESPSSFNRFGDLRKHQKAEHGKYVCEDCNVFFRRKCEFQKHRRQTGHGEFINQLLDVFRCDDCGTNFHTANGLRDHRRRKHSETVQMYDCPFCDYKSDLKHAVPRHVRNTHETEPRTEVPVLPQVKEETDMPLPDFSHAMARVTESIEPLPLSKEESDDFSEISENESPPAVLTSSSTATPNSEAPSVLSLEAIKSFKFPALTSQAS